MQYVLAIVKSFFDASAMRRLLPWSQHGYCLSVDCVAGSSLASIERISPSIVIAQDRLMHISTTNLVEMVKNYDSNVPVIILGGKKPAGDTEGVFYIREVTPQALLEALAQARLFRDRIRGRLRERQGLDLFVELQSSSRAVRLILFRGANFSEQAADDFFQTHYPNICCGWKNQGEGDLLTLYGEQMTMGDYFASKRLFDFLEDTESTLFSSNGCRHILVSATAPGKKMQALYQSMEELSRYLYFSADHKVLTREYIRDCNARIDYAEISCAMNNMFVHVMTLDKVAIMQDIELLYFNFADNSLRFDFLQLLRLFLNECFIRLNDLSRSKTDDRLLFEPGQYKTIESEFEAVSHAFMQRIGEISVRPIKKIVVDALGIVQERYQEPISLMDAAEQLGVSGAYLSRSFQSCMSMRFMDYLNRVRISEAKTLLMLGSLKVSEIAGQVGFTDPKYFSRVFHSITGMSASEYKKQLANNLI